MAGPPSAGRPARPLPLTLRGGALRRARDAGKRNPLPSCFAGPPAPNSRQLWDGLDGLRVPFLPFASDRMKRSPALEGDPATRFRLIAGRPGLTREIRATYQTRSRKPRPFHKCFSARGAHVPPSWRPRNPQPGHREPRGRPAREVEARRQKGQARRRWTPSAFPSLPWWSQGPAEPSSVSTAGPHNPPASL